MKDWDVFFPDVDEMYPECPGKGWHRLYLDKQNDFCKRLFPKVSNKHIIQAKDKFTLPLPQYKCLDENHYIQINIISASYNHHNVPASLRNWLNKMDDVGVAPFWRTSNLDDDPLDKVRK